MTPYFFGYGSLVNTATHNYPDPQPAQLVGWRRLWVRTALREVVFLSVTPHSTSTIDGLIAAVPEGDWAALDAREAGYARLASGDAVQHGLCPAPQIAHYAIPAEAARRGGNHKILLSYLDVVVQGFAQVFGPEGVTRFFDTTDGWEVGILNDRANPVYPRAQPLRATETALVDTHLRRVMAPPPSRAP